MPDRFKKNPPRIDGDWSTDSQGLQELQKFGVFGQNVSRDSAFQQALGRTELVEKVVGSLASQIEGVMRRAQMDGYTTELGKERTVLERKLNEVYEFIRQAQASDVNMGRRADGTMMSAAETQAQRDALEEVRYRAWRGLRYERADYENLEKEEAAKLKAQEAEEARRQKEFERNQKRAEAEAERARKEAEKLAEKAQREAEKLHKERKGLSEGAYEEYNLRNESISQLRFDVRGSRVQLRHGGVSDEQVDDLLGRRSEARQASAIFLQAARDEMEAGNPEAARWLIGLAGSANNMVAEIDYVEKTHFSMTELESAKNMVTQARYQRSLKPEAVEPTLWQTITGRMPEQPKRGPLSDALREAMGAEAERLHEMAAEFAAQAEKEADPEKRDLLLSRMSQTSGLGNQLEKLLTEGNENQNNKLNKFMDFIAKTISLLGVSQILGRTMIQEPYQFRTRPALDVMGNQGEIGQLLSSAYGELEQHRVGLNQLGLSTGTGLAMAGMAMGGPLGAGIGILGAGVAATGLFGLTDDIWMNAPGTTSEEQILGQSLAKQLMNPERLVNEFVGSRAGLMAHGALDLPDMGYGPDGRNVILKPLQDRLTRLGFNDEQLGAMLTQSSLNIRGDAMGITGLAGEMYAGYGIDPNSVIAAGASAQRAGLMDSEAAYRQALGATATEDGPTSFTANILVPALMKVVESSAIQNLARNSEELKDEIFGLQGAMLASEESNLGNLAKANPQVLAQIYGSITQSIQSATGDPARMAHFLGSGHTSTDIIFGRMSVMESELDRRLQGYSLEDFQGTDPFGENRELFEMFRALFPDIGYQTTNELIKLHLEYGSLTRAGVTQDAQTGNFYDGGGNLIGSATDDELNRRINAILGNDVGQLLENMTEQSNALLATSREFTDEMLDIQSGILEFVAGDEIIRLASDAIDRIMEVIKSLNTYGVDRGTRVPAREADQKARWEAGEGSPTATDFLTSQGIDMSEEALDRPYSVGGFTGLGATHQITGVVHAEEYVISQNNVRDNREVLDAIQSGRKLSDVSVRNRGGTTYVSLRVTGADPESIYQLAEKAAERYITKNRLQYV